MSASILCRPGKNFSMDRPIQTKMQKINLWITCLALFTAPLSAGELIKRIPPEKFQAAGLHKLTEAELAELNAVIESLTDSRIHAVQDEARVAVAAAEAKAAEAETKATNARSGPSWLSALQILEKAGSQGGEEIQSNLKGTLKSFRGRRSFTLENGQVWQMIEDESHAGPPYEAPAVFIRPSFFGTFWLRIPQAGLRVKVKPQRLN